jgi:hypothetical protein
MLATQRHKLCINTALARCGKIVLMAACETPILAQSRQAVCPPRAQWDGTLRFMCPRCGKIGIYSITFDTYKFRCTNNTCRKRWTVGLVFREANANHGCCNHRKQQTPSDMYFPTHELEPLPWRSGDPIHKLITSEIEESQPAHAETAPESSE